MMAKRRAPATVAPVRGCPCGSAQPYAECCGPLHRGLRSAATAEVLMRSRYSAFAVGDAGYLLRTWHSRTRPPRLVLDPERVWKRLEVLATDGGGMFETTGTVEFRAHYRWHGQTGAQHERSSFLREDGAWVYLDDQEGFSN
jgi:SEC-C motif domain protein